MRRWLFKEEPTCYSYEDLERDGRTVWDGVTNALACRHLRTVRTGDRVFCYHTGKEKAVVGEMRVVGEPYPDPRSDDPKAIVVEVEPVRRIDPVTLARIRKDRLLAGSDLVRLPRLSVVPLSDEEWQRIEELSEDE
jgi:predicted RNA-binding protein with PUA-like domain